MKRGDFIKSIFFAGVGLVATPNDFLLSEKEVRELPSAGWLSIEGPVRVGDRLGLNDKQILFATTVVNLADQMVYVRNIRPYVIKISVGDELVNMALNIKVKVVGIAK